MQGQRATKAILAIGPEGGWTDGEIAAAQSCGLVEASLGRLILRLRDVGRQGSLSLLELTFYPDRLREREEGLREGI